MFHLEEPHLSSGVTGFGPPPPPNIVLARLLYPPQYDAATPKQRDIDLTGELQGMTYPSKKDGIC